MDRGVDGGRAEALVERARDGDRTATAELISGHLPLVYNVVGRALAGHPDTDDVVQETMLRAVDGLPGLRDPGGFRSWLVAIAMNQIRRRYRDVLPAAPGDGLHEALELPDPGSDFVNLTIVRLGLSEQRREVAEATRWLDETDRDLLALWWLEAAGELTRAELAAGLELSPQHAAVRVQRMKGQLEAARVVVRALAVAPPCPQLAELTASWDSVPSALWRKRIARHARECAACSRLRDGLVPAEGLLAGLAMLPVPPGSGLSGLDLGPRAPRSHRRSGNGGRRRVRPRRRVPMAVLGAAVVTVAAAGIVASGLPGSAQQTDAASAPSPVQVQVASAPTSSPLAAPTTDTPSASPTPSPSPSVSASTPTARTATPTAVTAQQQVLDLVNTERGQNGCKPLRTNSQLQTAAQRHSDDMAARDFFSHTNPDGAGPQARIEAAGYRWSTWGENIARGQRDAAAVMDSWMNSPGHRANILNCAFTEIGVGVHTGPGGPWWTQDFGAPA